MTNPWDRVLELAWDSYCSGTLPIGAVVTNSVGAVVAEGRNRRFDLAEPGQLAGSRIAHAEVNALASLPTSASYTEHSLLTNVEPCCLCMGAAIQTGVGTVFFAWHDDFAGSASSMTVDNPQTRRRTPRVEHAALPEVEWVTACLVASHYYDVRPGIDHVVQTWVDGQPELFAIASAAPIRRTVCDAAARGATVGEMTSAVLVAKAS